MAGNNEIFTVSEKVILEKRKNESKITVEKYDKLLKASKEKVKIYAEIDTALDNLEANASMKIDERIDEKIKLIEKFYEKEDKNKNSGAVKQKTEKALEEKREKLKKELREKADKKLPFLGGAIYDFAMDMIKPSDDKDSGFFDKIFSKIGVSIGMAILGFLGLKKGYEKLKNLKEENNGKKEEKVEPVKVVPEGANKGPEKLKKPISNLGMGILFELSSSDNNSNNSNSQVYSDIGNLKYSYLINLTQEYKNSPKDLINKKENGENIFSQQTIKMFEEHPENIFNIISKISSENSKIILDEKLNNNNLKSVINSSNLKEKKLISQTTIDKINNGASYKDLELSELSILLTYSFPVLGLLGLKNISAGLLDDLKDTIGIDSSDELKNELNSISDRFISKNTLSFFINRGATNFGGKDLLNLNINDFENDTNFKKLNEIQKAEILGDLKKLIDFKDNKLNVIIDNTLKIKGLNLENNDREKIKKAIAENLNYKKIIEIYIALGGLDNIDINNIGEESLDNGLMFLWLKSVLDKSNTSKEYGLLKGAIIKKYIENINKTKKGTTTIILDKIFTSIVNKTFSGIKKGASTASKIIEGHEFEAAGVLSVISLAYFKKAKLIGGAAFIGALYLFSSGAFDHFKNTEIYKDIKNLLTEGGKITIDEAIENTEEMIKKNII